MARSWTEKQREAMDTRDRTLLVSAAAGSGKTATLTERIIRSILDEDNPIDIADMLIVTFTKAATGELRERIGAAISAAIEAGGPRERLERQLHALPSAKISTIDSFCSSILKGNSELVGVDPGYRIIDPAEAELLAEGILNGMLGEIYDGALPEVATPEELMELADSLTDTSSEGDLAAVIRMLYDTTKDLADGTARIASLVEEYNPDRFTAVENTRLGAYAIQCIHLFAEHHGKIISDCLREHIASGIAAVEKKIDVLRGDLAFLDAVKSEETYLGLYKLFAEREHPKTPPVGRAAPHLSYATEVRKRMKADTDTVRATFLEYSEDEWRECYGGLYRLFSVLLRLVEHFDMAYKREKLRISALEYSDVTRYTYNLLWQGEERTAIAYSERQKYRAIYIDEYQDVNALQHKIFEAISSDENRFMVGDIKQSIYGFRGADPTIFRDMKTAFPTLGTEGDRPSASIFMSENFRCDRGVVDFVNSIFDNLFLHIADSIGFLPEDRLVFSKKYDGDIEPPYKRAEICLLPYRVGKSGYEEDEDEGDELMPSVVALKIKELLRSGRLNSGEPVRPGDVAIIMRNSKGRDTKYAAALAREGIPSAVTETESFFLSPDVLLITSILHAVDNPRRDVYLAATMSSPPFGFTADELVRIAALGEPTLYDNLVRYVAENPDFTKGASLLSRLSRYRTLSEGSTVDRLISRIYSECGLLALASIHGGRDTLIRFLEHARQFEGSSFRGLYNFIHYINGVIDRQNSFDKREAALGGDEVKIITAHSSKGLEFPVVFFVGSEQLMKRKKDGERRLLYDSRFGISMQLRTPSGLALVTNPTKPILLDYCLRRRIEEEARLLYVALTRAREQLYVVGKCTSGYDKYAEKIAYDHENLSQHSVYSMSNYTDMITFSSGAGFLTPGEFLEEIPERLMDRLMPGAASAEDDTPGDDGFDMPDELPSELILGDEDAPPSDAVSEEQSDVSDATGGERLRDVLLSRFGFKYPYEHDTRVPRKMSVSRLSPEVLDPEDAESVVTEERITKMGKLPVFATGSDETESARRGIATHLLFQFCDLERLHREGAEAELKRLRAENYLSEEDAKRVRIREVEMFRRSPLFAEMLAARRIWRELRFNTRLPADMFATDPAERERLRSTDVLVQGVIDCLYEDKNGELHLVDYKTDRLTREERESPELGRARLRAAHTRQLSYYAEAVKRMFEREVATVAVYSLHLGESVPL